LLEHGTICVSVVGVSFVLVSHEQNDIISYVGDLILHLDEFDQQLVSNVVSTVGKYVLKIPSPAHVRDPSR
jgi:hypothetical protein